MKNLINDDLNLSSSDDNVSDDETDNEIAMKKTHKDLVN